MSHLEQQIPGSILMQHHGHTVDSDCCLIAGILSVLPGGLTCQLMKCITKMQNLSASGISCLFNELCRCIVKEDCLHKLQWLLLKMIKGKPKSFFLGHKLCLTDVLLLLLLLPILQAGRSCKLLRNLICKVYAKLIQLTYVQYIKSVMNCRAFRKAILNQLDSSTSGGIDLTAFLCSFP